MQAAPARTAHCARRQEPPPPFPHCFPIIFPPFCRLPKFAKFLRVLPPALAKVEIARCGLRKSGGIGKIPPHFSLSVFLAIFIPSFKKILRLHSRHIAQYGFRKTQRNWKNPPQNFSLHNFSAIFGRQAAVALQSTYCPAAAPRENRPTNFQRHEKTFQTRFAPKKAAEGVFKRAQKTKPETRRNPI